ncbi:28S ribosomal protein S16, mitochondrial-like [Ostrea edulis]|uniref:28S ribosomal protein S16, mitochondrial-like n=1 Tax=Ostrea edulis TaxID=37623 RepID=UPI0024AFA847|nr:28S ribosomal protein S16, mitochondrial-like [Ostrea edulis]XP_048737146.2 28S ribosomal protein S16, mitochondrial-like [Ostrea edulis]
MKPYPGAKLVVRMARYGCTNRPFYHIVVTWNRYPRDKKIKEQIGFYDRLPNQTGEQVLGLNLDRVSYYFKYGAQFSRPVLQLLGIIGYFPIHPYTLLEAKRITRRREELEEKIKGLYNEQKSEHSKETIESESLDIDQSNVSDTNVPVTSEILSESLNKARELSVLKL